MSMSKLREMVKDWEAWQAVVRGVTKSDTMEWPNNTILFLYDPCSLRFIYHHARSFLILIICALFFILINLVRNLSNIFILCQESSFVFGHPPVCSLFH